MTKKIKSIRDTEGHGKYIQRAEYADFFANCSLKATPEPFLEKIADDLLLWVDENPDAIQIYKFLKLKGLTPWALRNWSKRNENLERAYKWALYTLGQRREEKALKREFDSSFVRYTMPMFDEDFKSIEEWRAKLREAGESGDKIVVIERFPEVASVPVRKKDE